MQARDVDEKNEYHELRGYRAQVSIVESEGLTEQ